MSKSSKDLFIGVDSVKPGTKDFSGAIDLVLRAYPFGVMADKKNRRSKVLENLSID